MPRKQKSKKEIVSDIQLVENADRRRSLVKDLLFPYLVGMKETVGYSKVFLQAFSSLVNGVFDKQRDTTTVSHITPGIMEKLREVFSISDPEQKKEYDRYVALVELLKDVSIQDLSYATELPRYIDGYLMKDTDKQPISGIPIDKILGK